MWLCAAPLKKGRVDWLAEKACELGVARLVPVVTRRTVVDKPNTERLRAHMIEAAEQCGRTALPEVAEPVKLAACLRDWPRGARCSSPTRPAACPRWRRCAHIRGRQRS